MISTNYLKLLGILVVFLSVPAIVEAQTVKDLPPPPPVWKAKPTPPPKPPEQEVLDVVKVSSNLVMVPVSVTDSQGQAVKGLSVADFRLEEEGKQQEIAEIGDPEQVPLDIALLFDISSSVSKEAFFRFQRNAAASFLRLVMKPSDRASIFTIASQPVMVQALASSQVASDKVGSIPMSTTSVPTAFYDTVSAATKYLLENSPSKNRRVIIVLSDGDDNFSERIRELSIAEARATQKGETTPAATLVGLQNKHRQAVTELQQAVQKADVSFYSVNPGGPSVHLNQMATRAQNGMQSIADATGGTAFLPDSDRDLEVVFSRMAAELRGQYILQYYADSETAPGKFRRIAVTTPARADLRVKSRQGYYSKKQ